MFKNFENNVADKKKILNSFHVMLININYLFKLQYWFYLAWSY